ncbi:MAG TPA: glycosyltransferase [Azospirillaceae bacterium]|nr:glycosyltransferase [Azospirillaceae bacterium]
MRNDDSAWVKEVLCSHEFARILNSGIVASVIYPYFERPDYLLRSIASVLEQRGHGFTPKQIEIVVVDDGSADTSVATRLPKGVIYLWQPKNLFGASRARNTGAKVSNGKYLFFVDPDVILDPFYIASALEQFRQHGDRILQSGYIWDYFYQGCEDPRTEAGVWEHPNRPTRRFFQLASGAAAMARTLFIEAGGFDEDLIYGGWEDIEFGDRVGRLPGTTILFNTGMECRHIAHPPSPRQDAPELSLEICRIKHPAFYEDYVIRGMR